MFYLAALPSAVPEIRSWALKLKMGHMTQLCVSISKQNLKCLAPSFTISKDMIG